MPASDSAMSVNYSTAEDTKRRSRCTVHKHTQDITEFLTIIFLGGFISKMKAKISIYSIQQKIAR